MTSDLCTWAIYPINMYFFLAPSHKRAFSKMDLAIFTHSAIKAVGHSDHQKRAVGWAARRAVRNSSLTKKLTDEFCLFFTDMTYVPGQFIPYIYFVTKP